MTDINIFNMDEEEQIEWKEVGKNYDALFHGGERKTGQAGLLHVFGVPSTHRTSIVEQVKFSLKTVELTEIGHDKFVKFTIADPEGTKITTTKADIVVTCLDGKSTVTRVLTCENIENNVGIVTDDVEVEQPKVDEYTPDYGFISGSFIPGDLMMSISGTTSTTTTYSDNVYFDSDGSGSSSSWTTST